MNKLNDNKGGRESITLGPVTLLGLFHCAAHYRSVVFDNRTRKLLHLMIVSVPITPWTPNPLPIFSTPANENKFVTPSTAAAHAWHEWLIAALLITFIMKIVLRPRQIFSKIIASRLKNEWEVEGRFRFTAFRHLPRESHLRFSFLFFLLFILFHHSQIYFPSSRQLGFYIA